MKVVEIIRAALTRLGVYATGEEVSADDSLTALRALNDLLEQYRMQPLMGLPIELVLPLGINDAVTLPNNLNRVVITGLAIDIAPDYGIEKISPLINLYMGAITSLKHSNGVMLVKTSDLKSTGGTFYAGD